MRFWRILLALVVVSILAYAIAGCPGIGGDQAGFFYVEDVSTTEALLEYGDWIDVPRYGRVWRPFVVYGWRPFYYGHWIWTIYGWTWVSYEPFGWIVFHYGCWGYDRVHGWFWIPGETWYPAAVTWFRYGVYVGWAPMPPPDIVLPPPWIDKQVSYWNVVKIENLLREKVGDFAKPMLPAKPSAGTDVIPGAPRIKEVEHLSRHLIPPVEIKEQKMKMGESVYLKPELPEKERIKVERHRSQVIKRALKPVPPKKKY